MDLNSDIHSFTTTIAEAEPHVQSYTFSFLLIMIQVDTVNQAVNV